jgi:sarcosine oxidase subunit gamma
MAEATLKRIEAQARWSLRLPASGVRGNLGGFPLPRDINRCAREGERLAARLGPDEWLLCAPEDSTGEFGQAAEAALASEPHSLVDVGHRYAAFTIEGSRAHVLLAAGCPLDLHPQAFGPGWATRTLFGKAEIVLWRIEEAPAYRVECARTFAPYVDAFLREAAREFA